MWNMNSKLNLSVKNGNFLISLLVKQYFQGEKRKCSILQFGSWELLLKNEWNELLIKISPNDVLVIEMQHHYYYIYKYEIYIFIVCLLWRCKSLSHHSRRVCHSASRLLGSTSRSVSDSPLSLFTNHQQHSSFDRLCIYIETMMMAGIGFLFLFYW